MSKAKFARTKPHVNVRSMVIAAIALTWIMRFNLFAGDINFDGLSNKQELISDKISNQQTSFKTPLPSEVANDLDIKFFRVTAAGEEEVLPEELSDGKAYYKFKPNEVFYWRGNCPAQSGVWHVCLKYRFYPDYAGHIHNGTIPPYYSSDGVPMPSPHCRYNLPVGQEIRVYFRGPQFATRSEELNSVWGACGTQNYPQTLDFKIDGLASLPPAWQDSLHGGTTYYNLIGYTPSHPNNHFGKSQTFDLLKQIAWDYYVEFSTYSQFSRLEINDISLRFGGLFDVDGEEHPYWIPPHHEHRYGRQADLRRRIFVGDDPLLMPENQQKRLVKISCKHGVQVFLEGKNGELIDPFTTENWFKSPAPHFHLRFPKFDNEIEDPPDVLPNLSNCPKF